MHQNTSTTNFPWKKRGCRLWSCYHHAVSPILALYSPTPIITDLNSDGSTGKESAVTSDDCDIECSVEILSLLDLLYMTPHHYLMLETFPDSVSPLHTSQSTSNPVQQVLIHSQLYCTSTCPLCCVQASVNVHELSGGGTPLAMATGYLRQYQSMIQIRQQVC